MFGARHERDDVWSIALVATVVAVAVAALVATGLDLAASIGDWFVRSAPIAANTALAALTVGPLTFALVAIALRHRQAGAQRELARRSAHDALTGLPTRSSLPALVARAERSTRDGAHQCAVLFCDLNRFKQVNDAYGHEIGDELMTAVAERIREQLEGDQTVVRYGGDEFVVIAGGLRGVVDAERLAGRILRALQTPFEIGPDTIRISAAIGIALSERGASVHGDLVRDADIAMYHAKSSEGGAVCQFEPTMRGRLSRATASVDLHGAVDRGEIAVRYTPILSVHDGELVAVRAELHWEHSAPMSVSSRELVAALEDTGLIVRVGTWMIAEACRDVKRWRTTRPVASLQVLVPVAPRLVAQATFRDDVARSVASTGAQPNQLCLVVTDQALSAEITDAWTMLRHVRALGVGIALDRFGSGRSSLADLRQARLDQLSLDPALVEGLDHSTEDAAIAQHVINLAHELNIVVTADAITTPSQLAVLRRMGCDRASGPFLGLPLQADDIDLLLQATPEPQASRPEVQPLPRLRVFGGPADV